MTIPMLPDCYFPTGKEPSSITRQIPELILGGYIPLSAADCMELYFPEPKPDQCAIYTHTGDALAHNGRDEGQRTIKVILDSEALRQLKTEVLSKEVFERRKRSILRWGDGLIITDRTMVSLEKEVSKGGLKLSYEEWEELRGPKVKEFSPREVARLHGKGYVYDESSNRYLPENSAVEEFWNFVGRGHINVEQYVAMVGELARIYADLENTEFPQQIMSVNLDIIGKYENPILRHLALGRIKDGSAAIGHGSVTIQNGYLIGRPAVKARAI